MSSEPTKSNVPLLSGDAPAWWRHCTPVLACRKELANTLTHAAGCALSIIGAVVLMQAALATGQTRIILACALYASSLVAVYAASTLSHLIHEPRWRSRWRSIDQGCIFLLIVGTYTPFGVTLPGWNWPLQLLMVMWAMALTGFVSKVFFAHRVEAVSIATCVLLGWLPTTATPSLAGSFPPECLWLMIAGGVSYTLGTLFLARDEREWFYHPLWHVFVIGGSAFHFLAILWYAVPA